MGTLEDVCKDLEIPMDLAKFQDIYNPVHIYCRIKELSTQDFNEELKQYQKVYNMLILKIKLTYKLKGE